MNQKAEKLVIGSNNLIILPPCWHIHASTIHPLVVFLHRLNNTELARMGCFSLSTDPWNLACT